MDKILIANRGEIASRIMRTCRKMGIDSVAVYSDADRDAPFVTDADEAVHIGDSVPAKSYLNHDKIIDAAKRTGAQGIHPGYGFLSENVAFAKRCQTEGLIFIGPNIDTIENMGSKSRAKNLMAQHKVPVLPGYSGDSQDLDLLSKEATAIGFPLLIKATAGGGGRGMRIVHVAKELEKSIAAAKREALSAFGNDHVILEKYIQAGRHIEFQIFGDQHGNIIHLFERECSIQRRYQKIIEESPSPILTKDIRNAMAAAAINAARAINYDNAGTVEFIFDQKTNDFYFLEVNTRLQVEHPVTEEITGLDLVQLQIEVAQGHPLTIKQEDVQSSGYAIEARLYAEDPLNNFLPASGTVAHFSYQDIDGLRMEASVKSGSEISIYYDPMIAKIIVHDNNRNAAHRKLNYALRNLKCIGLTTNLEFLIALTENEDFNKGEYDTHFISRLNLDKFIKKAKSSTELAVLSSTVYLWNKRKQKERILKPMPSGWRNNFLYRQFETFTHADDQLKVEYQVNDNEIQANIGAQEYILSEIDVREDSVSFELGGLRCSSSIIEKGDELYVHNPQSGTTTLSVVNRFLDIEKEAVSGGYVAPMPSQVIKVFVKANQKVKSGDSLAIISSMKMENTVEAQADGVIEEIYVTDGQNVEAGFLLLKMKE